MTCSVKMGTMTMTMQAMTASTKTSPMSDPMPRETPRCSSEFTIGDATNAMSEPTARNSMTGASTPKTLSNAMPMMIRPTTVQTRNAAVRASEPPRTEAWG